MSSCLDRAVFERESNPRQAIRKWLLYRTELSNGAGRIRTCDGSLEGECSTGLSYRAIDRDCCSGMHEADTRGGLGHRRELKSLPVGCISDAVEGDIARGVPGLFSMAAKYL